MKKFLSLLLVLMLCFAMVGYAVAEEDGEEYEEGESYIEYDLDYIFNNTAEAYGGLMDNGEYVGFGLSEDQTYGTMFFFTPEQNLTFVGEAAVNGTTVTIIDETNGLQITFTGAPSDDGIIIDIGEYGQGLIQAITPEELVNGLEQVIVNTTTTNTVAE